MPFSLSKYTKENRPTQAVYLRIGLRALILFGLGLFLALFSLTLDFWLNGAPADSFANMLVLVMMHQPHTSGFTSICLNLGQVR